MTVSDSTSPDFAITFHDTSSLSAILNDCWSSLHASTAHKDCGWRLPVLASACPIGNPDFVGGIRQRIVVLRDVDVNQKLLVAHTDLRSPKVAALLEHPAASWLFYDPSAMSQLQVGGSISIHHSDEIADRLWETEPESSLRGYLAPFAPGTVCDRPEGNLPTSVVGRVPGREELQAARPNFAVITCKVESIEWLLLSREGNLRARFDYVNDSVVSQWLAT